MNKSHLHQRSCLLLFLIVLITLGKAQEGTSLPKDTIIESKRTKASHPMIVKTQGSGPQNNIFCSLLDKSGNLWFGTTGEGVYRYDGKSFTNYTTKDGLNSNSIWSMTEDKAGNILFGTGRGINRYDGKSFINLTQNTALSFTSITAMLEDHTGRLWVSDYRNGFYERGIYLYKPSAAQTDGEIFSDFLSLDSVQHDDDLRLLRINSILEDAAGNIWFAGQNEDNICRYDGKSLRQYTFTEEVGSHYYRYRSMCLDKKGKLWLGTHGQGLVSYVPPKDRKEKKHLPTGKVSLVNFTENAGPSNSTIMSIIEDKKGNLWFCTDGEGVWRYNGRSFKNFNTEDGLLNNSVFSVVEDQGGNLWFGTRNTGLYRYDGKSFVSFSE